MIRDLFSLLLPLTLLIGAPAVRAQDTAAADALVKDVTQEVLATLRRDKDIQSGDSRKAMVIIEEKIAPHFDFQRMTTLAVGASWRKASPEQQQALAREFRTLLVRTYANALTAYRNQTVSFRPTRQAGGDEVVVRSQINQPGGKPVELDYSLARSGGEWKVYDVAVENISLVTNYRSSFATEVDKGGVDGLIASLREKNRRPAADGK